jgi:hypothetical protein
MTVLLNALLFLPSKRRVENLCGVVPPNELHRSMRLALAFIVLTPSLIPLRAQPAPSTEKQDPFIGKWRCSHKLMVEIRADGSAEHTGKVPGHWKAIPTQTAERRYEIRWKDGAVVDAVTLDNSGENYSAKNNDGFKYTAERIDARSLKETVQQQIERLKAGGAKPGVPPEFIEKLNQLFLEYPISHFVIDGLSKDGKPTTTRIFIKGEEVYIAADQGWNLVADDSGVYEWEAGKQVGIKIMRDNEELLSYVNYLTDPSGILSALYNGYGETPEKYEVVQNEEKGWTELRLKTPLYGFEAVFFSEKPFWLHGMRVKKPDGKAAELSISKPRKVDVVPEEILQRFKAVKFEDSDLSLKRHLIFL